MAAVLSQSIAAAECPVCSGKDQDVCLRGADRLLKKCRSCGVYFLEPRPTDAKLNVFFSETYISGNRRLDQFGRNRYGVLQRIAAAIQEKKASGAILDVGCAGGYFLNTFFNESGWRKCGVELSRFAAEQASRSGIEVHVGDIHSATYNQSFDIVAVLDTVYYFPNPRRELVRIRDILKPDGILAVETPLAHTRIWRNHGWLARLFHTSRTILRHDDLLLYDPKSLCFLLNQSGFRISRIDPLPGNEQDTLLLAILYRCFFYMARLIWVLSLKRWMIAPRFLVLAWPQASANSTSGCTTTKDIVLSEGTARL